MTTGYDAHRRSPNVRSLSLDGAFQVVSADAGDLPVSSSAPPSDTAPAASIAALGAAGPSAAATNAVDRVHSVSPSLVRAGRGQPPAYEVKFLIGESVAQAVARSLEELLRPDPHADPRRGGAYRVTTYYFDTPDWDVLRAVGRHRRRKYRLRQYGDSVDYFVERKTKNGQQVRKLRDAVEAVRLPAVVDPAADEQAPGGWFGRQLGRWRLSPTCRIRYERQAFYGVVADGPIRLTFDRSLVAAPVAGWSLQPLADERPADESRVICEFKFRGAMPSVFKQAVERFQLEPSGFSKYRQGMSRFQGAGPSSEPPSNGAPEGVKEPSDV